MGKYDGFGQVAQTVPNPGIGTVTPFHQRASELIARAQQAPVNKYSYGYQASGVSNPTSLGYHQAFQEKNPKNGQLDPNSEIGQLYHGRELRDQLGKGFAFNPNGDGGGNADLALRNIGNQRGYENAVSERNMYETGGWGPHADSSRYYLGGNADWAGNRVGQMDAGAAAMGQPSRYQPGIDLAGMYQAGAAGQIAGVGNRFGGVANQIGGAANGAGYAGQMNAAQGLYAMGQQPQGPSAAEMAMRAQAGQALQTNAALAAGARGANAGLGMRNAAMGNAAVQGNLVAQLGQQRANEDLAYRTQRMQALGAAGQTYQGAMGSQVSALGQQANVLGGQAQVYGGAGQMAGAAGDMASRGAQLELARDEAARGYYGMGNQLAGVQLGADMGYDAARTGNYLNYVGIKEAGANAKAARDDSFAKTLLGGGLMAAGAIAAPFTGGASLAAVPAGAAISRG